MSPIARCCLCDQRVRIPDVDAQVWVRCPHCHEEYQLLRVAHDLPPRLEVVGERPLIIDSETNDEPTSHHPDTRANSPSASPDSSDPPSVGSAMVAMVHEVELDTSPSDSEMHAARVRSPQTLHANRMKTSGHGGLQSFVKVALGGIAGLVLGQIILWWLPQPYQTDPLQLAARMPSALQFLLPANLRNEGDSASTSVVELDSDVETDDLQPDASAVPSKQQASPVEPRPTGSSSSIPRSSEAARVHVPPTDLKYSLRTAVAANTAYDDHPAPTAKHVRDWYDGLKQLAFCATNIDSLDGVNAEFVEEMREFLQELLRNPEKVAVVNAEAQRLWTADPLHSQEGIVLVGKVSAIRAAGELFSTSLGIPNAADGTRQVEVISRQDPRQSKVFRSGDVVLVLGVLVEDPTRELQGFKGLQHPVVFGGFPVRRPHVVALDPAK